MEDNVADALKMAAAVLIFIVALGTSISSFTQARITTDAILEYSDREYTYTYVDESDTTERIVGAESIIPVIYRSFKENYKIYFYEEYENDENKQEMELYTKTNTNGTLEGINFIDLKRSDIVVFGNDREREDFIMALLYGDKINASEYGKSFGQIQDTFAKNSKIHLKPEGLYDTIKNNRYIERIGEYYQEDEIVDGRDSTDSTDSTDSLVPDSNKTIKRVYTYIRYN